MNTQSRPNNFFTNDCVSSSRVIYTPSSFARSSLLYLQECGRLKALRPHVSSRTNLQSFLLFVVTNGSGWLEYENTKYRIKSGDVCFIDCKKGYRQSSGEELWRLSWAHFNSSQMRSLWNKWTERGGKPVFRPADPEPFIMLLDKLYKTASSESYIRDIELNTLLTELMGLLFRETVYEENADASGKEKTAQMTTGADRIDISKIKTYIDAHCEEQLTLELLADWFHFNKNYIARVFKEAYGMSVGNYIALVRIGKAKELLRFTDMNVEQCGYECGFREPNYFSRVFKRVEGCSPSEFRKNWVSRSSGE